MTKYKQTDCVTTGDNAASLASLDLPFDTCGVKRERSLSPRGEL